MYVICPMTEAKTGIDTAVYIRAIAEAVHPEVIIAADALCAKSRERLQTVIQISDCGITPGSALSRTKGEISSSTMPCPVVTIGVPTVISTESMDGDAGEPLLVTRAESDLITDCYSSIIAGGIHSAIYGK
jgi:spore protease